MGSYRNEMERRERLARENGKRLAKKRHPFADPRPAAQPGVVKGLKAAERALRPLYNRVFNDNGDLATDMSSLSATEINDGYFAYREVERALAAHVSQEPVAASVYRPNWPAIYDDVAHTPDRDGELVNVTRETARLALSAIANQQAEEAYHNFLAAAHEIRAVLASCHLPKQESSSDQITRLAEFIMAEVPGEPSQNEGAVDTAIRCIRALLTEGEPSEAEVERIAEAIRRNPPSTREVITEFGFATETDYRPTARAVLLAAKSKGGQTK